MSYVVARDGTKLFFERFDPPGAVEQNHVVLLLMGLGMNSKVCGPNGAQRDGIRILRSRDGWTRRGKIRHSATSV